MPDNDENQREKWLRNEISGRLGQYLEDPSIAISMEEVFAELETHHARKPTNPERPRDP